MCANTLNDKSARRPDDPDRGADRDPANDLSGSSFETSRPSSAVLERRAHNLRRHGFDDADIAAIRERAPDLQVDVVEPQHNIRATIEDAVLFRDSGGTAVFKFNGRTVIVGAGDTAEAVEEAYHATFRATPAEIAAQAKRDAERAGEIEKVYQSLPPFLKEWAGRNPDPSYDRSPDVMIAKDAQLIAATLRSPEAIEAWYLKSEQERRRIVPGVGEGASGFSLGRSAQLAIDYLLDER